MEDFQIISQLKAGSEKAFDLAYKKYAAMLMAFCYSYVKSREDAEEIVQDTFVKLWTHREEIKNEQTVKPFLVTIAHRRIIDILRKRVDSTIFEDYIQCSNEISSYDNTLDYDRYVEVIKKAIEHLPHTQAKILLLSRFEGKTNQQIADILSISEKTVKNQLSIGRKALHEVILKLFSLISAINLLGLFV